MQPEPSPTGRTQLPLLSQVSERQWLALDAVTAFVALLATAYYLHQPSGPPGPNELPLGLLAWAPIALRRRWPLPVLGVVTAAVGASAALGRSAWPLTAALGLAGYMAATRVPRNRSILAFVGAEALLGVAIGVAELRSVLSGQEVQIVITLAASWFLGDGVGARRTALVEREEQERVRGTERAGQAVREERVRIARELHDVVAHSLAVITVQAGVGRRLMARQPEQAATALESIEAVSRTAQDELRVVLGLLRDDDEIVALEPAPGLADVCELVETVRSAGTAVELHMSGTERRLSPALELSVYRIIQEALTNVVKHASTAHVSVDLTVSSGEVSIEVTDDAGGAHRPSRRAAAAGPVPGRSAHGILGMHERVGAFGGSLVAEAVSGVGFRVAACIPLPDGSR